MSIFIGVSLARPRPDFQEGFLLKGMSIRKCMIFRKGVSQSRLIVKVKLRSEKTVDKMDVCAKNRGEGIFKR